MCRATPTFSALAISPGSQHRNFIPLEDFKSITGDMMRQLRGSRTAPDQERIYTAGEKEYYNTLYVMEHGVEITPGVQKG